MVKNKQEKLKQKSSKEDKKFSYKQMFKELRELFDAGVKTLPSEIITRSAEDNRAFFVGRFKMLKKYHPIAAQLKGEDYDDFITACFQEYIDWQINKFTMTRAITINADKAEELIESLTEGNKPDKGLLQ